MSGTLATGTPVENTPCRSFWYPRDSSCARGRAGGGAGTGVCQTVLHRLCSSLNMQSAVQRQCSAQQTTYAGNSIQASHSCCPAAAHLQVGQAQRAQRSGGGNAPAPATAAVQLLAQGAPQLDAIVGRFGRHRSMHSTLQAGHHNISRRRLQHKWRRRSGSVKGCRPLSGSQAGQAGSWRRGSQGVELLALVRGCCCLVCRTSERSLVGGVTREEQQACRAQGILH